MARWQEIGLAGSDGVHFQRSGARKAGKYRIVAIKREQETLIPRGLDAVHEGDLVYCVCPKENMEFLREELGKPKREIKNVIFFGGDRVTRKAATELTDEMNIKKGRIRPTIVVAIDNTSERIGEFCPDDISQYLPAGTPVYSDFAPQGNDYLRFIVEELKPFIEGSSPRCRQ